jgi:Putative MetA-pathway of phenol degradation
MMLFPVALDAQEQSPNPTGNQSGKAVAQQTEGFPAGDETASAQTDSTVDLASDADGAHQANASPRQPAPAPATTKRKIPGSMVGYIDDAIIRSQIRIRFDAGFHDNAPDRAEFFYAQCSCISGPGPNPVVTDLNFQQLYLHAEYAPRNRFSFFTEVPVRGIQPTLIVVPGTPPLNNEVGLSDFAAGFKLAAVASSNRYLTFQLQAYFPSGDASLGLGTNHYTVEPALLYYQRFSDRVALEAQVGDSHPEGGSSCPRPCNTNATAAGRPNSQSFAGDVFFYGVGPSYVLYRGEDVSIAPVVELVGWKILGGFWTNGMTATDAFQEAVSADGLNILNLKVGARTTVGAHGSFYIGYGHQLTHADWYKEIVRAEYRYSF